MNMGPTLKGVPPWPARERLEGPEALHAGYAALLRMRRVPGEVIDVMGVGVKEGGGAMVGKGRGCRNGRYKGRGHASGATRGGGHREWYC